MAVKKNSKKKYIVVFQDEDGNVLKTSFVPEGEAASPPEVPAKKGETEHHETVFAGWTTDFSQVADNLVVKAVYKEVPKKYLVMYFHENDRLLGMESVAYGSPAKAEPRPEKPSDEEYEYTFAGWSCPLDCIEGDTRAKAVFEPRRKVFTVRFFHEDGLLLKEEQVQYGEKMHPPAAPAKETDMVYHYEFERWSEEPECITENVDIYAVFRSVYNEYTVAFYDGEELLQEETHHYGAALTFPDIKKKGYDLFWSETSQQVERSCHIHAGWTFSNPVGKEVSSGRGTYRIVNPSVKNGTVVCTGYADEKAVSLTLPERVKLGDYYYRVEGIGDRALEGCRHMQKLYLPDSLSYVEDRGLAGCRRLKTVVFGKALRAIGAEAFAGNVRMKEIVLQGAVLKKCHRHAFGGAPRGLVLYVRAADRNQAERALRSVSGHSGLVIRKLTSGAAAL